MRTGRLRRRKRPGKVPGVGAVPEHPQGCWKHHRHSSLPLRGFTDTKATLQPSNKELLLKRRQAETDIPSIHSS